MTPDGRHSTTDSGPTGVHTRVTGFPMSAHPSPVAV